MSHLPRGAHQALKALAAWLAGLQGPLPGGGGLSTDPPGVALPGQPLGLITQQHAHVHGQHVGYAGGQQLMQGAKGNHLVSQLEKAAAVPLADAAHL